MRAALNGSTRLIAGGAVAVLTLVACKPRSEMAADESTSPQQSSRMDTAGTMKSMPSMPANGEMGTMSHTATMDSLRMHMREMSTMDGDAMMRMMPMHREMATGVLRRMTAERQSMNMSNDAKWNALADSVRRDLAGMSAMSASSLKTGMPAHQGRVTRLMQSHADMMNAMK